MVRRKMYIIMSHILHCVVTVYLKQNYFLNAILLRTVFLCPRMKHLDVPRLSDSLIRFCQNCEQKVNFKPRYKKDIRNFIIIGFISTFLMRTSSDMVCSWFSGLRYLLKSVSLHFNNSVLVGLFSF